jgi:hypothetical protein
MVVFRIKNEPGGWYVVTDVARSGPCLSMPLAVERAQGMAQALRQHGERAMVEVGEPVAVTVARWPERYG